MMGVADIAPLIGLTLGRLFSDFPWGLCALCAGELYALSFAIEAIAVGVTVPGAQGAAFWGVLAAIPLFYAAFGDGSGTCWNDRESGSCTTDIF